VDREKRAWKLALDFVHLLNFRCFAMGFENDFLACLNSEGAWRASPRRERVKGLTEKSMMEGNGHEKNDHSPVFQFFDPVVYGYWMRGQVC
jgi:hypothetical protein